MGNPHKWGWVGSGGGIGGERGGVRVGGGDGAGGGGKGGWWRWGEKDIEKVIFISYEPHPTFKQRIVALYLTVSVDLSKNCILL